MDQQVKSSKHVGVYWDKADGRWRVRARLRNKQVYLGNYIDEDMAGRIYREFQRVKPFIMNPSTFIGLPVAFRNKVIKELTHVNFTDELIEEVVKKKIESPSDIIDFACLYFDVDRKDLVGHCRRKEYIRPRQMCIYGILLLFKGETLKNIGRIFSRDHSSIIHTRDSVKGWLDTDKAYKKDFQAFLNKL